MNLVCFKVYSCVTLPDYGSFFSSMLDVEPYIYKIQISYHACIGVLVIVWPVTRTVREIFHAVKRALRVRG